MSEMETATSESAVISNTVLEKEATGTETTDKETNDKEKMETEAAEKEAWSGDHVLEVPMSKMELDDLISSVVNTVIPKGVEIANRRQVLSASIQIGKAERKAKDISKTLNQSLDKIQKYLDEVRAEEREIEAEIKMKEKMLEASCEVIDDDDSDDDITFIGSSFEPNKITSQPPKVLAPRQMSQTSDGIATQTPVNPPTLANLRAALTNTINRQTGAQAAPHGQSVLHKPGGQAPELTSVGKDYVVPVWTEISIGSKVLAKKFNDIWYSGVVTDLAKPDNSRHAGEWKYRVKFDWKGMKVVSGHHIAYRDPINPKTFLKVGTRVAALYRDDESGPGSSYYAGIVAEAPSFKNQKRFLVFFDDGYAQYCWAKELHKVYYQSENVWEDIHPDSQEFIKEYLKQYPERPMVRLMNGQIVKTEWNGRWWTAKVMEVDASLVKMYFQADKRTEWIYRGSTRLEPLFKALANAEAIKAAGTSKGRRLNMDTKGKKKPTVEYTRGVSGEDDRKATSAAAPTMISLLKPSSRPPGSMSGGGGEKKRPVARKSTGNSEFRPSKAPRSLIAEDNFPGTLEGWEPPWLKMNRRHASQQKRPQSSESKGFEASSISSNKQGRDMASVLQERLASAADINECVDDREALGERMDTLIDTKDKERKKFVPHACGGQCVKDSEEDVDKHTGKNPLLFPLLCGWERQICKMRPGGRKCVVYRTPCGRRLRTIEELDDFLSITDSQLFIDHFCYDPWLHVHTEFVPVKTFCDIKDLSYGKEKVPISCVNAIDRQYPDYVEYSSFRIPAKGVKIPLNEEFLQCCDCTDNCKDRSKCACQQLTVENTTWIGETDPNAGYHHRRLKEPIFTGVVECNSRCKCDQRCRNRVAQNGLSCRLQVFKTEKRGWGLRCLNDIPKGGFICIYAGQLLTDMGANDDGKQYGDEYLAELDFIEVVERQKEGYESDVEDPDNIINDNAEEDDEDYHSDNAENDMATSSDSDFESGDHGVESKVHVTRRRVKPDSQDSEPGDRTKPEPLSKLVLKRHSTDSKEWTTEEKKGSDPGGSGKVEKMEEGWPIELGDEEDSQDKPQAMDVDELPDLDKPQLPEKKEEGGVKKESTKKARKSTGGSRFKNLPNPRMPNALHVCTDTEEEEQKPKQGTRSLFRDTSSCYIMDAKSMGNIGRYLNHSCSPNVFVQNIFVDTHDLRFPWVAFFAGQYIRAGTELTWDYNYEVGSVPDKVLYCYCGSPMCRGRLL
ncbi:histone-lysine N-methyltransferase SETDB1-like [Babylonia areolata]|uniref:histone-lysine N-methyltransferase SETDB1-like n=1 Tax=Babylonia areolata TaxID=304850 RepID=UPI003FD258B7